MIQINGVAIGEAQENALFRLLGQVDDETCAQLGLTDSEASICSDVYQALADARALRTRTQALAA